MLSRELRDQFLSVMAGASILEVEQVQSLWSGYGYIYRVFVKGAEQSSYIIKSIQLPDDHKHPRGWNTNLSHQRKVKSYEVEFNWYKTYAQKALPDAIVPRYIHGSRQGENILLIIEDLNALGYTRRVSFPKLDDLYSGIKWLASFHAKFMGATTEGLWTNGTYWHLATRPDELNELTDKGLKEVARHIDAKLTNAYYQTLVHGDAKVANFCFQESGTGIAAVDFQYVGGGCGMKDLAYLIGSCLYEDDCEKYETQLLDHYFTSLTQALNKQQSNIHIKKVESEWRMLYPYAWADFHRFLKGWSPGHWKINSYSERICKQVIKEIKNE
ncbi:MAG: ecdysteroid 22-kinase family protein [Lentisphaeria bacterium]|nr:ecdysteroid 22-kinase family protein [Lentisphaeria bacterium]